MSGSGLSTVDFGAFPGKSDANQAISGQTGILLTSEIAAWVFPVIPFSITDHSPDEHKVETLKCFAANIVVDVGFTLYLFNSNQLNEPLTRVDSGGPSVGGQGTLIYGLWFVAWVWV